MTEDDHFKQIEIEKNMLLPDRFYMVLRPTGEDSFAAAVYDTTGCKLIDDEGHPHPAEVAIEGVLGLLNSDLDRVFTEGLAAKQFSIIANEITSEDDDENKNVDNIIRIDFGPKQ